MKLKKFFISAVMIGLLTSFTVQTAYAVDIGNELNIESSEKSIVGIYPKIEKEDVSYSYEWSDFERVSNNLNTYGSDGGTISVNRTVTFSVDVEGNIKGIGINVNASVTSEIGYSLEVPANRNVHLGYRVRYKIEKGTRVVRNGVTNKVMEKNEYTVKTPIYGEYKLINN